MKEDLKKADLLAIDPKEIDQEIKIEIVFSEIAKWAPKELLKITISIKEWLQFLEDCFVRFDNAEHVASSSSISLDFQKSQVKFIGSNDCSFAIPNNKWKRFVEEQVEKLFLLGVI